MVERPKDRAGAATEGVIVEFHRVGNVVKVSAVDTRTLVEVSIMAPPTATEREMTEAVVNKLTWVQSRRKGSPGSGEKPAKRR